LVGPVVGRVWTDESPANAWGRKGRPLDPGYTSYNRWRGNSRSKQVQTPLMRSLFPTEIGNSGRRMRCSLRLAWA
jgi:hypothetical protein